MNPYTYSGLTDDELYEKCAMARFMLYMCVFAKDTDAFTRYCTELKLLNIALVERLSSEGFDHA